MTSLLVFPSLSLGNPDFGCLWENPGGEDSLGLCCTLLPTCREPLKTTVEIKVWDIAILTEEFNNKSLKEKKYY